MEIISYTPIECLTGEIKNCQSIAAFARFDISKITQQEAMYTILTTIFTCFLLAIASLILGGDTERIIVRPVSKMVMVIRRLTNDPLKITDVKICVFEYKDESE